MHYLVRGNLLVWKERNKRAFNAVEQSNQTVKSVFLYTFGNWAVYRGSHNVNDRFCRLVELKVRRGVFLFISFVDIGRFLYTSCVLY